MPGKQLLTSQVGPPLVLVPHIRGECQPDPRQIARTRCFRTPGTLNILFANRQVHAEAARVLYEAITFKIVSPLALETLLNTIGPTNQSALRTLELHAIVLHMSFFYDIDMWQKLCRLPKLSSLKISIYSDDLEIFAYLNEPFRKDFASKWLQPGPWNCPVAVEQKKHLFYRLYLIASLFVGHAKDTVGKRKRFEMLSVSRSLERWASRSANHGGLEVFQDTDYDKIEAGIMPWLEQELEKGGHFA